MNDGVVLSAAHAFLRDVEPLAAQFIARGLPADFVNDLRTVLAGLERAHADRERDSSRARPRRRAFALRSRRERRAVPAIDLIVRNQFAADAEMQAAWRRARRVGGRHQLKAVTTPTTEPAPASVPVSGTSSPPAPTVR